MIPLDDTLADSESDARSWILVSGVQTLENAEDLLLVFRVNPDTVIFDRETPPPIAAFGADVDHR